LSLTCFLVAAANMAPAATSPMTPKLIPAYMPALLLAAALLFLEARLAYLATAFTTTGTTGSDASSTSLL